jgi:hypothetical protein
MRDPPPERAPRGVPGHDRRAAEVVDRVLAPIEAQRAGLVPGVARKTPVRQ